MENSKEINALIQLLDDNDPEIYAAIKQKLIDYGKPIVNNLEEAWEKTINSVLQERIEEIIQSIHFTEIKKKFELWIASEQDLLEGCILLSEYQYPDLDRKKIYSTLEQIKKDVAEEIKYSDTPISQIRVLNHVLFEIHKYAGNRKDYGSPNNNYINCVLETKKGNHILLSSIYLIVAQAFLIPVYGVNLPENFIMCYVEKNKKDILGLDVKKPSFYINSFAKGATLSEREIDLFLTQLGRSKKPEYYLPCTSLVMISRMMNNLIISYQNSGAKNKVYELIELKQLIEGIE